MRTQHPLYADKHTRRQIFWTWFLNVAVFVGLGLVLLNADWLHIRLRLYRDTSLMRHWTILTAAIIGWLLFTTLAHELGHVLTGRLAGLRFQQIGIGPLRLIRRGAGWHVERAPLQFPLSGFVTSVPAGHLSRLRQRLFWFVLGGPLANLLLLLVGGGLFLALRDNRVVWREAAWLLESGLIVAMFSLYLLVTTLNPSTIPDGQITDGARLQMLRAPGAEGTRWCALVSLVGLNMQGTRPGLWPNMLIQQVLTPQDISLDGLHARMLAYTWAVDSGRGRLALRFLDEVMDSHRMWRVGGRERFALEKAFLLAAFEHNRHDARDWLARVRQFPTDHPLYLRAETAVLLLDNRRDAAVACAEQAIARLHHDPTGMAQAEIAWLTALIADPA